jgi:AbrB family looped-hinge helix DNA binding protein
MEAIPKIMAKRGRITIPYELRQQLGWRSGDFICFSLENGRVIVQKQGAVIPEADSAAKAEELLALMDALTLAEQFRFLTLALGRSGRCPARS